MWLAEIETLSSYLVGVEAIAFWMRGGKQAIAQVLMERVRGLVRAKAPSERSLIVSD